MTPLLLAFAGFALADTPALPALATHGPVAFAALERHVLRSADGGATWQLASPKLEGRVIPVVDLAVAGDTLVALTGAGIVRSTDDGATWGPLVALPVHGLPGGWVEIAAVGDVVLARQAGGFVARSIDGGATWEPMGEAGLRGVVALGGRFVTYGDGPAVTSADGLAWEPRAVGPAGDDDGDTIVAARADQVARAQGSGWTVIRAADKPSKPVRGLAVEGRTVALVLADRVLLGDTAGKRWKPVAAPDGGAWSFPADTSGAPHPVVAVEGAALVAQPGAVARVPLDGGAARAVPLPLPLPGTVAWGPGAPLPDTRTRFEIPALAGGITLPGSWHVAESGAAVLFRRPDAYGPRIDLRVAVVADRPCTAAPRPGAPGAATTGTIEPGATYDAPPIAAPAWLPAAFVAEPVYQDTPPSTTGGADTRWSLCVDAPQGAVTVQVVSAADPSTAPEVQDALAQIARLAAPPVATTTGADLDAAVPATLARPDTDNPYAGVMTLGGEGGWSAGAEDYYLLALRITLTPFKETIVAAGLDGAVGFTLDGAGLAYETGLRVGPGHWIGNAVGLGVYTGFGFDGVIGQVPFALRSPLGGLVQLHLGPSVTAQITGHGVWNYATRRASVGGLLGFDEYAARLDLLLGKRQRPGQDGGVAFAVGVGWRVLPDGALLTAQVGFGVADDAD